MYERDIYIYIYINGMSGKMMRGMNGIFKVFVV